MAVGGLLGRALGERLSALRVVLALALGEAEAAERVAVAVLALAEAEGEGEAEGYRDWGTVRVMGRNSGVYSTSPSCQVCTTAPPSARATVALDRRPAQPPTPPYMGAVGPQTGHCLGKSCSVPGTSAPAR